MSEFYDDFDPDFDPVDECDHEDYELDILTGRARCTMCGHQWYMSDDELRHDQERRRAPYPDDDTP